MSEDIVGVELLPCPFCGGEAERFTAVNWPNFENKQARCRQCAAEAFATKWQTRTLTPEPSAAVDLEGVARAMAESVELAWSKLPDEADAACGHGMPEGCKGYWRNLAAIAAHTNRGEVERLREALEPFALPHHIADQVLSMGRVEWGATAELTEAGHVAHLTESLRITREHFNFEDVPVAMHGLYLDGTETVLCHTGTSPNSAPNAQALAGAWNWLVDQAEAARAALSSPDTVKDVSDA